MLSFSHSLVICSRGRPESLIGLIDTILDCEYSNSIKILIVLNGHSEKELKRLVHEYEEEKPRIEIIESAPGLVVARNLALISVKTDIITFLDDDVLLPRNYLTEIDSAFLNDPHLDGLSPRIEGLYATSVQEQGRTIKFKPQYGKVTTTGRNYWVPDIYSAKPTLVEWLPGCSMSYRFSSIKEMQFSNELMLGPTEGYSLGEDVDFSMRLSKLIALNTLSINHLQAVSVRDASHVMAKARGHWLGYLARKYPLKVSKGKIVWEMLVVCFFFGTRTLFQPQIYKSDFTKSYLQFKSYLKELVNPILTRGSNER
jgi:glycosyltransferase involved in cell wall biosynthesis